MSSSCETDGGHGHDPARRAVTHNDLEKREGVPSVYEGFTFHMLRRTAGSLMALAGFDPAAAAERLEHTDGGALFLRTYRHLYPGEKIANASRLQGLIEQELDENDTEDGFRRPARAQPSR